MALSVYTPAGIVHETSVDFTKRVLAEPVHLVQYDASLPVLGVAVFDAGQYITLTASDTVSIRMDKGDGTFIYNPALGMSADGHTVYVQITEQMTVNYGRFEPVLELLRGNGYGCSSPVPLFIDKNPVPNAAIESTDEFQTIQNMYNTVVSFSDALDYLNTPEAQEDVANAEENATAAAQSASSAAQSAENAAAAVDAVEFTEAATRENINSGESLSTIMGKVKKWFADLKNAAFHDVANNYTTNTAGYVLDARLGPAIKSKMDLVDTLDSAFEDGHLALHHATNSAPTTVQNIMDYYRNSAQTGSDRLIAVRWPGGGGTTGLFRNSSFLTLGSFSSATYGFVLALSDNVTLDPKILCLAQKTVTVMDLTTTKTTVTIT